MRTKLNVDNISKEHNCDSSRARLRFLIQNYAYILYERFVSAYLSEKLRHERREGGQLPESEKVSSERNYRIFPATRRGQMRAMHRYSNNTVVVCNLISDACVRRDGIMLRFASCAVCKSERARAESVFLPSIPLCSHTRHVRMQRNAPRTDVSLARSTRDSHRLT